MAVKSLTLALAASAKRVSDAYGGTAGVADPRTDIAYRQLLLTAGGADAFIGDSASVSTTTGVKVALAGTMPVSLGPFDSGPLRLSDLYAVGAGSTLQILGVPF